jgi:hypothetical protein
VLLHTTGDIQLHGYVFGGRDVFVVYICVDACIWTKIQWLLLMKMCCMHWISLYVCFLLLCMCVVDILMVVVSEHITFALLSSYVGHSIIHHIRLIDYLCASS